MDLSISVKPFPLSLCRVAHQLQRQFQDIAGGSSTYGSHPLAVELQQGDFFLCACQRDAKVVRMRCSALHWQGAGCAIGCPA